MILTPASLRSDLWMLCVGIGGGFQLESPVGFTGIRNHAAQAFLAIDKRVPHRVHWHILMMDSELVILRVCQDINEAYFFRSVLEGSGVEAFIPDEYAVNYPPIAILGVNLLVRKEDIERAGEILASDRGHRNPSDHF